MERGTDKPRDRRLAAASTGAERPDERASDGQWRRAAAGAEASYLLSVRAR